MGPLSVYLSSVSLLFKYFPFFPQYIVTKRIPPSLSDDPSSDKGMARFPRVTFGPLVGRRRALAGSGGRVVLSGGPVVVACRVVVAWRASLSRAALAARRSLDGLLQLSCAY